MGRFPLFQNSIVVNILAVLHWSGLLLPMAACVGTLCAVFLWALDHVTDYRFAHPGLLWFLPVAGVAVGLAYHWFGRSAEGGNNLIVDQIHEPGGGVPLRMAPLVLIATVVSHLFGASVGREGTAVQIGGSVASGFARLFRLDRSAVRIILMAGIAAGFGAVFGTPVAGAVFAMELLSIGSINYRALVPVAAASIIADIVCHAWGIHHVPYKVVFAGYPDLSGQIFHTDPLLLLKVGVSSVCFGLTSLIFAESVHRLTPVFRRICPVAWLHLLDAHFSHYGFWRSGEIQQTLGEIPNTLLSVYVDILGDHEQLQAFCLSHEALLRDTSLYFKRAESWHFKTRPTP